MGNQFRRIKYFRDFNLENRIFRELKKRESNKEPLKMAPRHPSTAPLLKKREGLLNFFLKYIAEYVCIVFSFGIRRDYSIRQRKGAQSSNC